MNKKIILSSLLLPLILSCGNTNLDINGISFGQYQNISKHINYEFMEENNYKFAPYNKTLPNNESLYELKVYKDEGKTQLEYSLDKAYLIVDNNSQEVAVSYCIQLNGIDYEGESSFFEETAIGFVAISIEERKVIDICLEVAPYEFADRNEFIISEVDKYDFSNNILEDEPTDIIAGATISAKGVKKMAEIAYSIFEIQYFENETINQINFEFMKENNYEFATYTKQLPENSALYSVEVYIDEEKTQLSHKLEKAYSIINQQFKEVAVCYCVKVDDVEISNGYTTSKKTVIAFVALSIEERKVIDICLYTVPFVQSAYEEKVNNGINDYDYKSGNFLEDEPSNIIAGATMSSAGIQRAAQIAYEIFVSQYSA